MTGRLHAKAPRQLIDDEALDRAELTCQYDAVYDGPVTSELKPTTFRLETELISGLQAVKDRDGIPVTEQVRRAIRAWLGEKGVTLKTDRRRAATRQRS